MNVVCLHHFPLCSQTYVCKQWKLCFGNIIHEISLFQILSDKEKRQNFDMYGTTAQPSNGHQHSSPFFDPDSGFSFFFNGMPFQSSDSKPDLINRRVYYNTILPESHTKPYLIKFITEWCFPCEWSSRDLRTKLHFLWVLPVW